MFSINPKNIEARILNLARYSAEQLPPCFYSLRFQCMNCSIGNEDTCILAHNPDFLSLLRWKVSNLPRFAEEDISVDLVMFLLQVFQSQGSALHLDKVLALLRRQNPELVIDSIKVKRVLKDNPELFKEIRANVFEFNPPDIREP